MYMYVCTYVVGTGCSFTLEISWNKFCCHKQKQTKYFLKKTFFQNLLPKSWKYLRNVFLQNFGHFSFLFEALYVHKNATLLEIVDFWFELITTFVGKGVKQGCQIFLGPWYQNGGKCTKWTQNVPNGHKRSEIP
jgi:hypothetical protein